MTSNTGLIPHDDTTDDHSEKSIWLAQSWLEPRLVVITGLAIGLSLLGSHFDAPDWVILLLNITSYVAGGVFGAKTALESLFQERKLDVDMLMVLAAIGAATIGQWHEGAILLFLFSLSNVLQDYAIGRSRNAIKSLFKLYPEEAKVKRGETVQVVKISEIRIGDTILIEPGERIPVDGEIIGGQSTIDQSPITGESMPVDKAIGDSVFAGTLNKQGVLDVKATQPAEKTTLSRIIQMVEEAQHTKAPTERFLETFEQYYAGAILGAIALIIVIPPLLFGADFDSNFYRAMVLMTVASPCALVISVPASFISAIASGARQGVLFKGGAYLEALAGIKVVTFDKTGTLTAGTPEVTDIVSCCELSEDELLRVAATVESRSEHPLAKAIVNKANQRNISFTEAEKFEAITGKGILAEVDGLTVHLGSVTYLRQVVEMPEQLLSEYTRLQDDGKTVIGVINDDAWMGIVALADQLRPESVDIVKSLHDKGITVVMLTGDNQQVAEMIAQQVGIDRVYADLLPEDKVRMVEQLEAEIGAVAHVGDGVNDAPALAIATVGMAMGGAGTDVALETADVVLMGDKIALIDNAIALSQKARRVVWQNIVFSLAVIVMLILGALLIDLPLPLGVFGHEGSTVIVVLNGLISLLLLPEIQRRRQTT